MRPGWPAARSSSPPITATSWTRGPPCAAIEDGDRWRRGAEAPGADEIVVGGGRVLAPGGLARVILPWSEGVRYAGKKNGYHGGATPQEVLVPAGRAGAGGARSTRLEHCSRRPCRSGGRRRRRQVRRPVPRCAPRLRRSRRANGARRPAPQGDLFAPLATPPADDGLGRAAPGLCGLCRAEAARGTDRPRRRGPAALSARAGQPRREARQDRVGPATRRCRWCGSGGFLSAVRRVLNVDRSAVVSIDEAAGEVEPQPRAAGPSVPVQRP